MRAVTNSTYLVFAPNIAGGAVDGLQGYSQYDPGSAYYDLAGLSFYFAGQDKLQNTIPPAGTFSGGFQSFYDVRSALRRWPLTRADVRLKGARHRDRELGGASAVVLTRSSPWPPSGRGALSYSSNTADADSPTTTSCRPRCRKRASTTASTAPSPI